MILVGLVMGCGPAGPAAPPSESGRSASRETRLDALLDRLGTAVRDADRAAFDRQLSRRDPGFGSRAAMIFTNLDRLRPSDFDLRATGQTEPVSDDRAEVLGDGAFAAEVQLSWAMPGDRTPSDQTVWLSVVVEDGQARWAGTADGPDQARPTPLWWLEPVVLGRSDHATVVAGASVDLDRAVATAEDAATEIAARLNFPSGPGADWNGRVVLIMPSNTSLLEQTMGVGRGARSDLAAITWPDGSQLRQAPMRIIVNPSDGSRSELATELVLTHETVHVATRSPTSAVSGK